MVEKTPDEIPMEKFTISTKDYDDLMTLLAESRNYMQRYSLDGRNSDRWCKKITKTIDKIEKKYKQ